MAFRAARTGAPLAPNVQHHAKLRFIGRGDAVAGLHHQVLPPLKCPQEHVRFPRSSRLCPSSTRHSVVCQVHDHRAKLAGPHHQGSRQVKRAVHLHPRRPTVSQLHGRCGIDRGVIAQAAADGIEQRYRLVRMLPRIIRPIRQKLLGPTELFGCRMTDMQHVFPMAFHALAVRLQRLFLIFQSLHAHAGRLSMLRPLHFAQHEEINRDASEHNRRRYHEVPRRKSQPPKPVEGYDSAAQLAEGKQHRGNSPKHAAPFCYRLKC